MMDDEDETSTATMTSVTGDLSLDESDTTTTSNDIDTSSQITTSEANDEGNTTVAHTPQLHLVEELEPVDHDMHTVGCDHETGTGATKEKTCTFSAEQDSDHHSYSSKIQGRKHKANYASNGYEGAGMCVPDLSGPGNWYEHQCFDLYWRHYHYVSMWRQKHLEVYRSVVQQYNVMASQQAMQTKAKTTSRQPVFKKPVANRTIRNRKARRRRKAAKQRMRMALQNASVPLSSDEGEKKASEEGETTQSAVEGSEEEEMQVEISDEMLDFFAHTHRHRQERDALKKKNKEKEQKHINIEDANSNHKERTEDAPTERPGSKRTSEMRLLYGKGAAMIHGMETALQMTFDRNLDVLQPKLWPNMPFRVVFD